MIGAESLWSFLVYSAVLTGVGLLLGSFAAWRVRQPADRLRLIQWVLVCCLVAPWLPGLSVWKSIPLDLMSVPDRSEVTQNMEVAVHHAGPSETTIHEAAPTVAASPAIVVGSTPEVPQASIAERKPVPAEVSSSEPPAILASKSPLESLTYSDVTEWLVLTYLGIVAATVLWWTLGLWRRVCLERSAAPASTLLQELFTQMAGSTTRRVRLLVSDQISGPMTWGLIHPVIIVPTRFAESPDASSLRWSLAHELSHVERRDFGTLLLACGAQLVCFYQPLYWWLRRQMSLCQDYLADARAAQVTGSPEDYAEFLVRVAESRLQPILPATLGIFDRKSELFHRIKMLLAAEGELRSSCSRTATVGSFIGAVAFLALAGAIQLDAQEAAAPPKVAIAQTATAGSSTSAAASPVATKSVDTETDESKLEEGVVTGVVVHASDGAPVADATIILHTGGSNKTRSDANGRFRLEKIPRRSWPFSLWGHQGNLVTPKVTVSPVPTADPNTAKFAPVRLEMTEGKQATFTVTSGITGRPIAGAEIRFGYPDGRLVATDERGLATMQGLLALEYYVTIEADGHARHAPKIDLTRSGNVSAFKAELTAGGVVRGVALEVDGKPLPEAEVIYRGRDRMGIHGDDFTTSAEGAFRHRFLPLNEPINVSIHKKGYVDQEQEIVLTEKKRELDVRFSLAKLPPGKSIAGVVTDQKGRPVVGAKVTNAGNRSDQLQETNTDAEGKFILHNLYEGFAGHQIYVLAKGFAPELLQVSPGASEKPGTVEVTLQSGHAIHGRVKIEGDVSPNGAVVSVRGAQYPNTMGGFKRVNEDGLFEFDSLPKEVRFDVQMKGYAMLFNIPLELDRPDPITVTLQSPGQVRGRVIDEATGKPIPQFRIRLGTYHLRHPSDVQGTFSSALSDPGLTFSSDKGEFLIQPITNGMSVELIVEQEGFQRTIVDRVVAAKENQAAPIEISMRSLKPAQLFTLAGQFLDHAGKPKTGAQLRLIVSTNQPTGSGDNDFNWVLIKGGQLAQKTYCEQFLSGITNSEGRFEFKHIVPGRYLQLAYWGAGVPPGRSLAFDETKAGGREDVTIRLPEPARVHGSFERSKFPQAGSVQVSRKGESFQDYEVKLGDNQSSFEFDDLPPGDYFVTLMSTPMAYIENNNQIVSRSPLINRDIRLNAGDVEEVIFTAPDPAGK